MRSRFVTALGGFNEAAVLHGGGLPGQRERREAVSEASTRPPFFTAEVADVKARYVLTIAASTRPPFFTAEVDGETQVALLQVLGFNEAAVLHGGGQFEEAQFGTSWAASTRPPFFTAEVRPVGHRLRRDGEASTRPPFFTAEVSSALEAVTSARSSFNEAAVLHGGGPRRQP